MNFCKTTLPDFKALKFPPLMPTLGCHRCLDGHGIARQLRAVRPNIFSNMAHFLGIANQTTHCIFCTYFV